MEVEAALPADSEASELVEMADGLLDHPADSPESDDGFVPALRDDRFDSFGAQPIAEAPGVVAAIGEDRIGAVPWMPDSAGNRRDGVHERFSGTDVGDVAAGGDDRERESVAVAGDVVLRSGAAAVYRGRPDAIAPFFARTWLLSRQTADQSICASACSSESRSRCRRSQTPASVQRRNRRQQVTPEPNPSWEGRCRQLMPVWSTNRMPRRHVRSSSGTGPRLPGRCSGRSGAIRSQSASSMSHGWRGATALGMVHRPLGAGVLAAAGRAERRPKRARAGL